MGIEKMAFVDLKGSESQLDEVLIRCARCGMIQLENAARLSEYSVGTTTHLRNPYSGFLSAMEEIAADLEIPQDTGAEADATASLPDPDTYLQEIRDYLEKLKAEYPQYLRRRSTIGDEIASYSAALEMLAHVRAPDIDFDQLWDNQFLKIRFGRMPVSSRQKLPYLEERPYELYELEESGGQIWCLYVTAAQYGEEIDGLFQSLGFERLRIPEYVHGTATDAVSFIQEGLVEEREQLRETEARLHAFVDIERGRFLEVYTRLRFLHEVYNLRRFAVVIRGQFHVVGFVLQREQKAFASLFEGLPSVLVTVERASVDGPIPPPVKLRNGWFVRPFEMFVSMYGSPSYNDIDPTPFVACTYSLLFGMMFGDMGHGFCVFLLGLFLGGVKKMDLGRIMSRVGVVSMVFGFAYGSVFGFEHLLDPFFQGVMGFAEKPIHIMDPATTNGILAVAIGIGAAVILMVMLFNIRLGIRHRDFGRTVLSNNGIAGLIFYGAVLYAAVSTLVLGKSPMTTFYILLGIVLPLVLIFFKEPLVHYLQYRSKEQIIHSDKALEQATRFQEGGVNIPELFTTQYVSARFGRLPTDSYRKLHFYDNEPYLITPLKTDSEYIWCIYAMATVHKEEIDAIFHDLYFERIFIPDEAMATAETAEAFIRDCVSGSGTTRTIANEKYGEVKLSKPKTIYQTLFPSGLGGFFTETFFELFEVILSFITNTMSFLRVGGFILVHAGMMEVVFKLSEMVGGGASPVIIVVGNLFVMAMEGLIVGIQVLRLEFYEIFSRFFDAAGEPFRPFAMPTEKTKS